MLGGQQLKASAGGKGLGGLGEVAEQAIQGLAACVEVVPIPDMPGCDQAQPLGPPALRLVGQVQQQGRLLDAEVGLVKVLGKEPGQPFPGGRVVGVTIEDLDAGIGFSGGLIAVHF